MLNSVPLVTCHSDIPLPGWLLKQAIENWHMNRERLERLKRDLVHLAPTTYSGIEVQLPDGTYLEIVGVARPDNRDVLLLYAQPFTYPVHLKRRQSTEIPE